MTEAIRVYVVFNQPSGTIMSCDDEAPKIRDLGENQTFVSYVAESSVADAVECARVVGVLDAWAKCPMAQYWRCWETRFGWSCDLVEADGPQTTHEFAALTAAGARALAAKAIEAGEVQQ
jgi:hypothetical protein